MCENIKAPIPRNMFEIPIQAANGGDMACKKTLLENQKTGTKKKRQFGKVDIPQAAFINVLTMDG
ncbi:MAG: hypothetical protein JJU40_16000 [Rhodobacteraceae bacterium]|nr:hypothetical protein [Paracoccaceae bacterium]MCC6009158.1 hypothetical protein [Paracoccaceae bacterium]